MPNSLKHFLGGLGLSLLAIGLGITYSSYMALGIMLGWEVCQNRTGINWRKYFDSILDIVLGMVGYTIGALLLTWVGIV